MQRLNETLSKTDRAEKQVWTRWQHAGYDKARTITWSTPIKILSELMSMSAGTDSTGRTAYALQELRASDERNSE